MALAALCFLVAAVCASTLVQVFGVPKWCALLLSPLATAAAAGVYGWGAHMLSGITSPSPSATEPQNLSQSAGTVALAVVAAIGGSLAIAWVSQRIFGHEVQEQARIVALFARRDPVELAALGMSVIVLAPVAEEWLFRGFLFRRLRHWCSLPWALGMSASLFAAVHGNLSGLSTYLWLAACFTFALVRSGRLGCAIFVHAANNAATFLLLFLDLQS